MNYSNNDIRLLSKDDLQGNWGAAILLIIISGIIVSLVGQLFGALGFTASPSVPTNFEDPEAIAEYYMMAGPQIMSAATISGFLSGTIQSFFNLGINFGYLDMVDGGKLKLEHLISAFTNNAGKNIIVVIITQIIIGIGFLLLVIPGIILSFMFVPIPYILRDDPDMEIMDILRTSREMMKGHKFNYFTLILPYILIPFAVAIASLIIAAIAFSQEIYVLGGLVILAMIIALIALSFWTAIKIQAVTAGYYRRVLNPIVTDEDMYVEYEEEIIDPDDEDYIIEEVIYYEDTGDDKRVDDNEIYDTDDGETLIIDDMDNEETIIFEDDDVTVVEDETDNDNIEFTDEDSNK